MNTFSPRILTIPVLLILLVLCSVSTISASEKNSEKAVRDLIAQYLSARQMKDESVLRKILTDDIDQLVSSGNWRYGMEESIAGMMRSSANNPGERRITVEQVRFPGPDIAIADAKYQIRNADGSMRNMWSTFIVTAQEGRWKITAIRNMLPANQQ